MVCELQRITNSVLLWDANELIKYRLLSLHLLTLSFLKMTRSTALGLLNVGNNGNEILAILDVIVAEIESEQTINGNEILAILDVIGSSAAIGIRYH